MRILKPEVAKKREEEILLWIIQQYVETRKPVSSELISKNINTRVSSATIRNIMKNLEEQGYLHQSHVSGGRVPTDKAYRFYVDYVSEIQRYALEERESIEQEYRKQMEASDRLMAQTSRMLAMLSRSAGFVYSASICGQCIRRLDFVWLGPRYILAVLVSESGTIHHWPLRLANEIAPDRLRLLSAFINEQIKGLPLNEARVKLWKYFSEGSSELHDVAELARDFLQEIDHQSDDNDDLYIDGIGQLAENAAAQSSDFCGMLRVMEEKRRFSGLLSEKLRDTHEQRISVTIGTENELRELRDMSIVSSTYRLGERAVGMLGIVGPKHMEYPRMISLVNFFSELLAQTLRQWDENSFADGKTLPAPEDRLPAKPKKKSNRTDNK